MDLLHRHYNEKTTESLWERIQLQCCEFLKEEPALGGVKITTSIYDPILIFAWYKVIPDKPALEDVQQDVFKSFIGSFETLGKIFNLNRRLDNQLAGRIYKRTSDIRIKEIGQFPASFRMGYYS